MPWAIVWQTESDEQRECKQEHWEESWCGQSEEEEEEEETVPFYILPVLMETLLLPGHLPVKVLTRGHLPQAPPLTGFTVFQWIYARATLSALALLLHKPYHTTAQCEPVWCPFSSLVFLYNRCSWPQWVTNCGVFQDASSLLCEALGDSRENFPLKILYSSRHLTCRR